MDDRITTLVCFRRQIQESEPWRGNDLGHQEDLSGSHVNHLKNLSNHLSNEERDKLTAAIHGYLLGKKEAASGESSTLLKTQSNFFSDPGSGSGSKVLGKIDVGSSGQGNYGKKINVWDKVNKVRVLLKSILSEDVCTPNPLCTTCLFPPKSVIHVTDGLVRMNGTTSVP